VITGCSSGIGLQTALAFARQGDQVFATMRNPGKAKCLAGRAAAEGLSIRVCQLDVDSTESARAALGDIRAAAGEIDVLVNNAGAAPAGSCELISDTTVRQAFETNFHGTLRTIQAVLPWMRERRSGVIINVTSIAGRISAPPVNWAYAASKHAAVALSEGLAREVAMFGVRVVSIEPGFFATEMMAHVDHVIEDSSPYAELQRSVHASYAHSVANGADPAIVADAIVAAARNPATPLHVPVGEDAEMALKTFAAELRRMGRSRAAACVADGQLAGPVRDPQASLATAQRPPLSTLAPVNLPA
jgi:NAD(P)-dependent dehydrogenase (short-subunit alcohol dehydrogenase family)